MKELSKNVVKYHGMYVWKCFRPKLKWVIRVHIGASIAIYTTRVISHLFCFANITIMKFGPIQ